MPHREETAIDINAELWPRSPGFRLGHSQSKFAAEMQEVMCTRFRPRKLNAGQCVFCGLWKREHGQKLQSNQTTSAAAARQRYSAAASDVLADITTHVAGVIGNRTRRINHQLAHAKQVSAAETKAREADEAIREKKLLKNYHDDWLIQALMQKSLKDWRVNRAKRLVEEAKLQEKFGRFSAGVHMATART